MHRSCRHVPRASPPTRIVFTWAIARGDRRINRHNRHHAHARRLLCPPDTRNGRNGPTSSTASRGAWEKMLGVLATPSLSPTHARARARRRGMIAVAFSIMASAISSSPDTIRSAPKPLQVLHLSVAVRTYIHLQFRVQLARQLHNPPASRPVRHSHEHQVRLGHAGLLHGILRDGVARIRQQFRGACNCSTRSSRSSITE